MQKMGLNEEYEMNGIKQDSLYAIIRVKTKFDIK